MAAAFIKPLTSFVTKLAQNPKVQEAALDVGTALAGDVARRTLSRGEGVRPAARAQEGMARTTQMAPRNNILSGLRRDDETTRVNDAHPRSAAGLHRSTVRPQRPAYIPVRPESMNPDALPYMHKDGSWVAADDARNPAHAGYARPVLPRFGAPIANNIPPAHAGHADQGDARPVRGQPQPARPTMKSEPAQTFAAIEARIHAAAPTRAKESSFRQMFGRLFGASRTAAVANPKPLPDLINTRGRDADGRPIDFRMSRRDVLAYLKATNVSEADFDVHAYLKYEHARHDPMRPGNLKVSGTNAQSLGDLSAAAIDNLELNDFHVRQQILGG